MRQKLSKYQVTCEKNEDLIIIIEDPIFAQAPSGTLISSRLERQDQCLTLIAPWGAVLELLEFPETYYHRVTNNKDFLLVFQKQNNRWISLVVRNT